MNHVVNFLVSLFVHFSRYIRPVLDQFVLVRIRGVRACVRVRERGKVANMAFERDLMSLGERTEKEGVDDTRRGNRGRETHHVIFSLSHIIR